MLSPRLLHFADEELVWECREASRCECQAIQAKYEIYRAGIAAGKHEISIRDRKSKSRRWWARQDWYKVVAAYTSSSLSYSKDAFPALSGIAKLFVARLQDEYIAGMWRSRLVSQLLWYFESTSDRIITNVKPWRAPTWAWASAHWSPGFKVLPAELESQELAEVMHVICTPHGEDPTGELESAHLTLRTKVISGRMKHCFESHESNGSDYVLLLDGNFSFTQHWRRGSYTPQRPFDYMETGFLGLGDPRLTGGIASLDVAVAQIARWSGVRTVLLSGEPGIQITDEVRTYLLLAKDASNYLRWVRIGLVVITRYHPDLGRGVHPSVARLKKSEREAWLKQFTGQNRRLFDMFDEAEAQNITIW